MSKNKYLLLLLLLISLIRAENVLTAPQIISEPDAIAIPKMLNYQGKLTNLQGNPLTDSNYSITFRLFTIPSGGTAFWNETQTVITRSGLFNVLLGWVNQIDTIPQSGNCYLEMQVNPNNAMTPRIRLVSSAYAYLAKKADTAGYALSANISYVDSTRIATNAYNAYRLQGKDTIALSTKFIDEGEIASGDLTGSYPNPSISNSSVTSLKVQDGTIQREDVINNFKAPYADTSDYARAVSVPYVDSARVSVNAHKLQGKDTISLSAKFVDEGQSNSISNTMIFDNAVTSSKIQDGAIQLSDLAFTPVLRPITPPIATTEIADNAINSLKIQDATIIRSDVTGNFKAPYADTSDFARNANIPYVDSARVSLNSYNSNKLQGKDTSSLDSRYVNENQTNAITNLMLQDNSITSPKIQDASITRADVVSNFKAPLSDTADFARAVNVLYVDSARISGNAYKLQGKDTIALSAKFIDEGQFAGGDLTGNYPNPTITNNTITSVKIQDNTITRADVATNFKSPFSDTADYARTIPPVTAVDSARISVNAYNTFKLQDKDTIALSAKFVDEGQTDAISTAMIVDGAVSSAKIIDRTITRQDVANNFKAPYSDTSDYAKNINLPYVDSARISVNTYNAYRLQGKDTLALSSKFIDEGQTAGGDLSGTYPNPTLANSSVTTGKILNNTILREDVVNIFKAPYSDTADYARVAPPIDSVRISANTYNAYKLQGKDTTSLDARFVNEGQPSSISNSMLQDNIITSQKIQDATITRNDVISGFKAPYTDTADFARSVNIQYVDSAKIAVNAYNAYKLQGKDTLALSSKFIDEGQSAGGDLSGTYPNPTLANSSVTTGKILNNTILREDVVNIFKAPYSDTADYARVAPPIDSVRISANTYNAYKLQGKDTTSLDARFVNEGQNSSISTGMIKDTSITNLKLARNSVSTDKILDGTIGTNDIEDGAITTDKLDRDVVTTSEILNSTILREDVTTNFKAPYADTADYVRNIIVQYSDSARIATNSYKLQGKDTLALSSKFIDEGQIAGGDLSGTYPTPAIADNAVITAKIADNNVTDEKIASGISDTKLSGSGTLISNFNADKLDGQHASDFTSTANDYGRSGNATDLYEGTTTLTDKYVNESQSDAITSEMIQDGSLKGNDFAFPCTLEASTSLSDIRTSDRKDTRSKLIDVEAVLNIKNNGLGQGIKIINAGHDGINVNHADGAGFAVGNTEQDGFNVGHAVWDGLYVAQADVDGVYIETAGDNGFKANNCTKGFTVGHASEQGVVVDSADQNGVFISRSGHNGVQIEKSYHNGFSVVNAEHNGVYVNHASQSGVHINHATQNGVVVDSAGVRGIYTWGDSVGGEFVANTPNATSIIAHAYSNDAADTAIYAHGKGLATGGWAQTTKDGKEVPCIVSLERTIIAYGTATINNGVAQIQYPETFNENIQTDIQVRISLTPRGNPSGILCLTETKTSSFSVELKQVPGWNGDNNITFDWIAIGTMKEPETSLHAQAEWQKVIQERRESQR